MFTKLYIYINSENPKFKALDESDNHLGLATHIAECAIKELLLFTESELGHQQLTAKVSEFYDKSYGALAKQNLFLI